ncbi:hypothetical protein PLICRDRAFT_31114 [Plicaturopsis crispa FD-325 SS-3]|nr:hypothetical protein PLICRDRAFT_31114 [Plicaturopsis crispa FD-325 SS-3]
MGQSPSRIRRGNNTPAIVVTPPETTPDDHESSAQDGAAAQATAATKRSRRASVRRSLSKLVSGSSSSDSTRTRTDSSASTTAGSLRRRWRASRRWSKTPVELGESPAETSETSPEQSPERPVEPAATLSPPSITTKGKGKAPEVDQAHLQEAVIVDQTDRPSTPLASLSGPSHPLTVSPDHPPTTNTDDPIGPETSSNIGTWLGGQASLAERLGLPGNNDEDEVVIAPDDQEEHVENEPPDARDAEPPAPPATQPEPPRTRGLPPPGTLVVVQGVVHTTDVARNPPANSTATTSSRSLTPLPARRASSAPRPSSTGGRNRLSALFSRSPSPPSSLPGLSAGEDTGMSRRPSHESRPGTVSESGRGSGESDPNDETDAQTATTEDPAQPGALSANSIDILGTLLSVAAAATAASLLTGSSDPIFSSGFNPSPTPVNATTTPRASEDIRRPTSPSPANPVGGIGIPGLSLGPGSHDAHNGRNTRPSVSRAWGSLRERLGLRATNETDHVDSQNTNTGASSRTRSDGSAMNAREIMLEEMARAFNLGLGINRERPSGEGADEDQRPTSPSARNSRFSEEEDGRLPPEDSFERFLINLQADLRAVLSGGTPPTSGETTEAPNETATMRTSTETDGSGVLSSVVDIHPSASEPHDVPAASSADSSDTNPADAAEDEYIESQIREALERRDAEEAAAPPYPSPGPTDGAVGPGSRTRTERGPGGGVNWWRLYQFPSITAPQAQGLSSTLNGRHNASSNAPPASTSSSTPPMPTNDTMADHSDPSSSSDSSPPRDSSEQTRQTPAPADPSAPGTVIPVIIVGLQSFNANGGRGRHPPGDRPEDTGDRDDPEDEHSDAGDRMPEGEQPDAAPQEPAAWPPSHADEPVEQTEQPYDPTIDSDDPNGGVRRGRTWQSRAANAFRNLRPGGRRPPSRETRENESPGSRTFLIYVIGGYYPPDHAILTGNNNLNSFEAFWELAEMFGNHKPTTATKEDIEKSGLEIIKSSALEQYEKDGKISSNCVDRCLICLDDYEPEDDVRLLACRHAFHKNCVDKWLETGRNNCPACRSTGVSTDTATSYAA